MGSSSNPSLNNMPLETNKQAFLVSVLIPAKDEADNIGHLVDEIHRALGGQYAYEVVLVDDGSRDDTGAVFLRHCRQSATPARLIRHAHSAGQSTALWTAARHASGRFLVTIDGDRQNDPADIPALVAQGLTMSETHRHFCIAGFRKNRRDTRWKKIQSRIANGVRRRILDDGVADTGCGLKLVPRDTWLCLPYFDHMHRFVPALVKRAGGAIAVVPVHHRHRTAGVSKYTAWNRTWVGIVDLCGVSWLIRRSKLPLVERMDVMH